MSALVDFYRDALGNGHTLCLCVAFLASRESLSDDVKAKIVLFREMILHWLRMTFELGAVDKSIAGLAAPDREACATLALLEGAHLAARAAQDPEHFDHAVALLKARLIH